jgi:hypothetical protein
MAGVFKNLDASDIRLTPFQTHKRWNGVVTYTNYYDNVLAQPDILGVLSDTPQLLYATDLSSSSLLKLNPNDNNPYSVLASTVVSDISGSTYGQDVGQQIILAWRDDSGFGNLTPFTSSLSALPTDWTSTQVNAIADVSVYPSSSATSSAYLCGSNGASTRPFNITNGFTGVESPITMDTPLLALSSLTASLNAINAQSLGSTTPRVVIIGNDSVIGTYALVADEQLVVYSTASINVVDLQVKTLIYNNDQDLHFVLYENGLLYKVDSTPTTTLIASNVADILQDKSNYLSGSFGNQYQSQKIHVVYSDGAVGIDLVSDTTTSYDRIVNCRQYVALKPEVKASINTNQEPPLIGIFAGTTSSLTESVFFTVNPDDYTISAPRHMGATKGDLRLFGENLRYFVGYNSQYSERFIQFPTEEGPYLQYKADYNPQPSHPSYNPLNTLFDQGSETFDKYEPITRDNKFQRVVHKSVNHLYYESFYNNTKATFGSGNINNQQRLLEDQATIINLPQSKFGESIQPQSITVTADYNISGSSNTIVTIADDLNGNLYVSGGLISPVDSTVFVSGSVSVTTAGEWPTKDLYKYNDKGETTIVSDFNRGNWQMETVYTNVVFTTITGSTYPIPSPIDLLGVVPTFNSSASSSIQIKPAAVQDYRQSYNFENSNFAVSFMIRPTDISAHPSGSIIIAKQGVAEDYGVDENGNVYTYAADERSPYKLTMNSNYEVVFERNALTDVVQVSGSLSQNQLHHVVAMRTGSQIQLYVDGVLTQTTQDVPRPSGCSNKSDIFIGNNVQADRGFDGMIDNVKIYPQALTDSDIQILHHTLGEGSTVVGNVFYNHGMLVLGAIPARFMDMTSVTARGTHTIYEKEVTCTVGAGEFNRSNNPTLQEYNPTTNQYEFRSFTTGSDFKPYVTTIGLYNDRNEMIAVAKLGYPIKLPSNVDTTFVVRYDM